MLIKYIVLSETNHYGWVGELTTLAKAKKMLKIETEIFYIFRYIYTKTEPLNMKLRCPIGEYYDCLSINEYTEEILDEFILITCDETNTCDKNMLIIEHHKPASLYIQK